MKAGFCFRGAFRVGGIHHYWVFLEDPIADGTVAIVNFTTPQFVSKKAHAVSPAFFNTLQHDSEVAWGFSSVRPADKIKLCIESGLFTLETGMTAEMVKTLIQEGETKKLIPKELRKRLKLVS